MKNERLVIVALLALVAMLLMRPADAQAGASAPAEPTVVGGGIAQVLNTGGGPLSKWRVFRYWSDGGVDASIVDFATFGSCDLGGGGVCGPMPILPGSCAPGITRNGNVDFEDILPILTKWGPCQE